MDRRVQDTLSNQAFPRAIDKVARVAVLVEIVAELTLGEGSYGRARSDWSGIEIVVCVALRREFELRWFACAYCILRN